MDRKELIAVLVLVALVAIAATARLSDMMPIAFSRKPTTARPAHVVRRPSDAADAGVGRFLWPQDRRRYRPEGLEATTLFDAGERIFAEDLFDAAIATYRRFIERHPRQPASEIALFRIAQCHNLARRDAEAAKCYDDFLTLYPSNDLRPMALLWSGIHHARLGQTDLARTRFTEVIEKSGDSPFATGARQRLAQLDHPEPASSDP